MVEISQMEGILLKLQKEREERLKFEAERPYRKASYEKSFDDLTNIFVRALQSFHERGLIDFSRQPGTYESSDFGNYAAEVLTISAGDRRLALIPQDGQAATLSAQPPRGRGSVANLSLIAPLPGTRSWAYRTEDFLGSMPSPAQTRDRMTLLDETSARFLVERLLSV